MAIQEVIIPTGKRYLEYRYIITNLKPNLFISSYYNDGLIFKKILVIYKALVR